MSRTTAILLLILSINLALPGSADAQVIDTLSYFDPDSLEGCAYTGNVIDLAVHFQVPAGWQRYGILELGILTPGPQTAHLGNWLYICSFNDSLQPGDVIDSVQVTIQDNPSSSPLWTVIDLAGVATLQGMTGDFWVRGPALFTGLIDNSIPSGHSYWYVIEPDQTRWGSSADIPLRAVIQDQSDSLAWLEYFPHHVGDKWLYRYSGFTGGVEKLVTVEVTGDSLMDNSRRYWHFGGWDGTTESYRSQFFRVDTAAQRVYEYRGFVDTSLCPNREVLRFDFSSQIPYDSAYGCSGYEICDTLRYPGYFCRESRYDPIGIDTISAPCYSFISQGMVYLEDTYSRGFGLTQSIAYELLIITGSLVAAEIDGIHYGEPFTTKARPGLPATYRLFDPYPNPFNPATTIRYELPQAAPVTITIYDLLGREVVTLVDGYAQMGTHEAVWDAGSYSSGIYIAKLVAPGYAQTIKLVLLK